MQALCLLPQSLHVHMCAGSVVFRESDFFFVCSSSPLVLTNFLLPLPQIFLALRRETCRDIPFRSGCFQVSLFLHIFFYPCFSVLVQNYSRMNILWWWLRKARIDACIRMSLRIILVLHSFRIPDQNRTEQNRGILLCLIYPDYWSHVLGHLISVWNWFCVLCLLFWDGILFMNLGVEFRIILLSIKSSDCWY